MKLILTDRKLSYLNKSHDVEVKLIKPKDLASYSGNADVVAIAGTRAMAAEAEGLDFKGLKFFQLTSAGYDNVPLEKYRQRGIDVSNAGDVYSVPIAETVVFGVLQIAKKLRKNPNNRRFRFTRGYNLITEIKDKKVLIMGVGNIGTAVAKRLVGFEAVVDGYDPYAKEKACISKFIRNKGDLLSSVGDYDYIISTLPDNSDTQGMINRTLLDKMKKTAVFVNVGRMAVVNRSDLFAALKTSSIGGAVLDMFEFFPNPVTNPFRRLRNVIVLPGVAAISKEVKVRLDSLMCDNLNRVIAGNVPENIINP